MLIRLSVFFVVFAWAGLGSADEPQVRPEQEDGLTPARTILGVEVGEHTLADVQQRVGPAKVIKIGDAGCSETIVCYRSKDPGDKTLLVFASHSEMAGAEQTVTSFTLTSDQVITNCPPRRKALAERESNCAEGSKVSAALKTVGGIRPGMTSADLIALLGSPSGRTNSTVTYTFEKRVAYTKDQIAKLQKTKAAIPVDKDYLVLSTAIAYLDKQGRVSSLVVGQIEMGE